MHTGMWMHSSCSVGPVVYVFCGWQVDEEDDEESDPILAVEKLDTDNLGEGWQLIDLEESLKPRYCPAVA